jgi:hypothetical protein
MKRHSEIGHGMFAGHAVIVSINKSAEMTRAQPFG